MKHKRRFPIRVRRLAQAAGFTLVEVTLAIGIASFCLLAVFGLLPTGLNSNRDSVQQTTAASLAMAIASDLHATNANATASPFYGILVDPAATRSTAFFLQDDGTPSTTFSTSSPQKFRATVSVYPPSAGAQTAQVVRIWITWPAAADQSLANPPSKFFGAFEVDMGLNRH